MILDVVGCEHRHQLDYRVVWVLGDEVEQSAPVDLEFEPWHKMASIDQHESHTEGYHGYTDGSRRISAACG
jgi:hypothetical protein